MSDGCLLGANGGDRGGGVSRHPVLLSFDGDGPLVVDALALVRAGAPGHEAGAGGAFNAGTPDAGQPALDIDGGAGVVRSDARLSAARC